ncbi:MAG TPA: winged helix-turn-helix domain-containing protein [Thiobacillaceae bacterium]|nr:winged helix-turn-helix domain-containing protein [Thiobacillaceae bacterium]
MRVGDWSVNPGLNQIRRGDEVIRLEPKVMEVLSFLAAHPGEVVSREALLAALWPGIIVGDDSLTQSVIKLRKAFGDDSRKPVYIQTIPKRGYRLLAPVGDEAAQTSEGNAPAGTESRGRRSPARPRRSMLALASIGGVLLVLVAAWLVWTGRNDLPGLGEKTMPVSDLPSLVVLPFANLNKDPTQDYFSDGLTGDLTTALSHLKSLWVIAPYTALSYKGLPTKASDVADDLGVRYVIEGSVQQAGARVRVNIQLTDARTMQQLWAGRFDRQIGDLFAIQDEIVHRIVAALGVSLSDHERKRLYHRYTRSVEAYDLFLRGREAYARQDSDDNARAQELFGRAIALDPNFARAYAALGLTCIDDWRFQWSADAERGADEALRLVRHAVELDGDLPEAYWALSFVQLYRRDPQDAIHAANQALALDPNYADAFVTLALSTAYAGDPKRAIGLVGTGMKLNPHYGDSYRSALGLAYFLVGQYEKAVPVQKEAIDNNPERIQSRLALAATYVKLGRQADAEWQGIEVLGIKPGFTLDKIERLIPFRTDSELQAYKALLRKAKLK